jgi:hypothetical protein
MMGVEVRPGGQRRGIFDPIDEVLRAKAEERETLLRTLFNTALFDRAAFWLEERAKAARLQALEASRAQEVLRQQASREWSPWRGDEHNDEDGGEVPADQAALDRLARALAETQQGRGFQMLRGLPVDRWSVEDARLFFWGLGLHLGVPRPQGRASQYMSDVRDAGDSGPDAMPDAAPTPVEAHAALGLWVKREDLAGGPYGGNKVRKLAYILPRAAGYRWEPERWSWGS